MEVGGPTGVLPDSLQRGLKIVFAGTAAGRRSAAVCAYYAHTGNKFWWALHEAGLTQRCMRPEEFRTLLAHGIGFTDIAKHGAGMDREISPDLYDLDGFRTKLNQYKPEAVAFTSKKAASVWFQLPTGSIRTGRQVDRFRHTPVFFVLPSPSGAATRYWSIEPWRELAIWHDNI